MKVVLLSNGNSIHTARWANSLTVRGHDVYLLYNKGHAPKVHPIDGRVKQIQLKFSGKIGYYLNGISVNKLLKKINPDVVNAHYASGYGTLARMAKARKLVLSVWGSDVYDFPNESIIKNVILKKNVKYADILASTSYCMAKQLKKVMGDENLEVFVTPFGVDTKLFDSDKFSKKNSNDIILGIIKSLQPKYGIDVFIESVGVLLKRLYERQLKDIAQRIKVEIYGDGEQKEELINRVNELSMTKIVSFIDRIPNSQVPERISRFSVFCATSVLNSESFGVSVVEAMAMKVPVVVSDVDGYKEVVEDKKTGIIVKRGNIEELAEALETMVLDEELRKELGENGRRRVEKLYNWDDNVTIMEKLYERVIKMYGK